MEIPEFKKRMILSDYYSRFSPILPSFPNFRQFNFKTWERRGKECKWVQRDFKTKTAERLKNFLTNNPPQDCYYTTSRFLDTENLSVKSYTKKKRAGFETAYNNILSSDFLFDLDFDVGKKQKAFDTMVKIYEFLKNNYTFQDYTFVSTNRGYQILIQDFYEKFITKKIQLPKDRENHIGAMKRKFVFAIKNKFEFDWKVSIDTRRVGRLFNTVHHSGVVCASSRNIDDGGLNPKNETRLW